MQTEEVMDIQLDQMHEQRSELLKLASASEDEEKEEGCNRKKSTM